MQPTAPSTGPAPGAVPTSAHRFDMPKGVVLGVVLVGFGVVFRSAGLVWSYFGFRGLGSFNSLAAFFQIQFSLGAAQALLMNLGFFLIYWGILRTLPRFELWYWVGPVLVLLGGLLAVAGDLAQIVIAPSLYPPANGSGLEGLLTVVYGTLVVASLAETVGTILALVAVARGVFAWRAMKGGPPPS